MDIYFYLLGAFIMSLVFVCGYKIGHIRGWRHGYNDYEAILEQKYRFRVKPEAEKGWDYLPKEKPRQGVNPNAA